MKAILEFTLPEDRNDFHGAAHASDFWCALWDIDQHLRNLQKYAPDLTDEEAKQVDQLREKFWDIMRQHNVTLEEYP